MLASATISSTQVSADSYDYSMTLSVDPASTEPVYSYWFAWIPGYDLLPDPPNEIDSPSGWSGYDAPDTYGVASILWSTNTNPIMPGQSLSGFDFTSPDPPSEIIGAISPYMDLPVLESYVYRYPAARGDSEEFLPTAVPEPSSGFILASMTAGFLIYCRIRTCGIARNRTEIAPDSCRGDGIKFGPRTCAAGQSNGAVAGSSEIR